MATFADASIDVENPYLQPGSADIYEVLPATVSVRVRLDSEAGTHPTPARAPSFLDAALDIGRRLVSEAVWLGDRCTWMTADLLPQTSTARLSVSMRPLGPDLYAGASGVALFLAELAAQTGDAEVRATARGAIRQAPANVDATRPELRLSLYNGWLGVAYAAVRLGTVLGEPEFRDGGGRLFRRALRETWDQRTPDLLAGLAGAVIAALALGQELGDDATLDWARSAGADLLRVANSSGTGLSWSSPFPPRRPDLTGYSHGAAGVGHALLELAAATGEERFHEAAWRTFAYERRWFDATTGNWADLRNVSCRTKPGSPGLPTMIAWCHGAPGIALARLRAWELTGDDEARSEARVALRRTGNAVAQAMGQGDGDCTLCHGLLGNAEVLHGGAESRKRRRWRARRRG